MKSLRVTHLILGTISVLASETLAANCWHGNAVRYCDGPFIARQTYCAKTSGRQRAATRIIA
jgi:hypothetical protein